MTIEEVFNLQPGAGGLHNLLDLHRAFWDEQGLFTLELQVTEQLLNPKGTVHGEPYLPYVTVLSVPTLPFKINGRLPWTVPSIFSDLPFAAIRCWPRCLNEKRGARFRPFLLKYIMTKIRALLTPVLPCTTRSRYYFFVIFDVYTT